MFWSPLLKWARKPNQLCDYTSGKKTTLLQSFYLESRDPKQLILRRARHCTTRNEANLGFPASPPHSNFPPLAGGKNGGFQRHTRLKLAKPGLPLATWAWFRIYIIVLLRCKYFALAWIWFCLRAHNSSAKQARRGVKPRLQHPIKLSHISFSLLAPQILENCVQTNDMVNITCSYLNRMDPIVTIHHHPKLKSCHLFQTYLHFCGQQRSVSLANDGAVLSSGCEYEETDWLSHHLGWSANELISSLDWLAERRKANGNPILWKSARWLDDR